MRPSVEPTQRSSAYISIQRSLRGGKNNINGCASKGWGAPHEHRDGVLILTTMLKLPVCLPVPNTHVTASI